MANKIVLKKSSEALKVPAPADLDYGELALNFADGKLYYKTAANNIASFNASAGASYTAGDGLSLTGVQFAVDNTVLRTTGSYADPSWLTSLNYSKLTGTIPTWNQNTTGSAATLTAGRTIALTGDVTYTSGSFNGSADVTGIATLATVNANVGAFGSATAIPVVTVNAKGLITAISTTAVSIPSGAITITGDVSGSGTTGSSTTLTLATVNSNVGTWNNVTVNGKGLVTAGSNVAYLTSVVPSNFASQTANTVLAAPNGSAGTPTFRSLVAADIPNLDASKITSGTIDAARLPSYVDDVIEAANLAAFPATGETGKIYVALDTNKTYRWSGSAYVYITSGAVDSVGGYTGIVGPTQLLNALTSGTNVIAINIGGTGATDAAGALTSLGAYAASNPSGYTTNTGTVTGVTATAPVASSGGTAPVISMAAASSGVNGYMTGAYATKLDGIASGATANTGTVTGVSGTAPIVSSGGTAPAISISAATTAAAGSMSAADKTKLDGIASGATANTGTVTSVATSGTVSGLTLTGGTITTTGTITLGGTLAVTAANFASQTANTFLAAPNGAAGVPTFRTLVAADVPTLNQNTTGTAAYATSSSRLYSTDASYAYGSAAPYYGYLSYISGNSRWRFAVTPATPAGVEVAYADTAGNAGTVTSRTLTIGSTGKAVDHSANVSWTLAEIGAYAATNPSGYTTNTGTVTGVTAVTPIISSGGTAPSISHATSGATAGTYNNVTVNTFGHVTSGSNTAYLTGESDTLATVTSRGNVATGSIQVPANSSYRFWSNDDAYSIKMAAASDFYYGPVTDYSLKLTMGSGSGRGITFGQNGVAPVAAINTTSGNMQIAGTFSAASKSFLIPHPTKPGMQLRYGSLEGPENGVYIRGKLKGNNKIELPEYWTKLVDPDSISVTLTPIGKHQKLYIEDIADNVVTVGNDGLFAGEINCFFVVYGERVDIAKLIVEE